MVQIIVRMFVHVLTLTCDCVAGSVMSMANNFRPSNGLPEPMGSLSVALEILVESRELQVCLVPDQLNISCARYLHIAKTVNTPATPFEANVSWWFLPFHSYSVSIGTVFGLSFAYQCLSNSHLLYFFIYMVTLNTIPFKNTSTAVTLSVRSSRLHTCSSVPHLTRMCCVKANYAIMNAML